MTDCLRSRFNRLLSSLETKAIFSVVLTSIDAEALQWIRSDQGVGVGVGGEFVCLDYLNTTREVVFEY